MDKNIAGVAVMKVRWDHDERKMVPTGEVGTLEGEAILMNDSNLNVVYHGKEFAGVLYWHENLIRPCVKFIHSEADLEEFADNVELHFFLGQVTVVDYAHPDDECAPRHTVKLLERISREEALSYNASNNN